MNLTIDSIMADSCSGSQTIARQMLAYFEQLLNQAGQNGESAEHTYEKLQADSKQLIRRQPNMVLLRRLSTVMLSYYKRLLKSGKNSAHIIAAMKIKLEQVKNELEQNSARIASMGSKIIATSNKIMTISKSTLVQRIFETTHQYKRRFEVFTLLSQPPGEGAGFAEALSGLGIKTTILADSQIGVFMPAMNLVLIGADRLYKNGFINKSGTLPLCLTAKHYNIPVYLAVETTKILLESERAIKLNSQDASEVYASGNKNLRAQNIYFEKTPLELVHKIICEDGVFETFEFINWYLKD